MNWLFFGLVVAAVLGVLDAPWSSFDDTQTFLVDGFWANIFISTLVVGCIFLCRQCWQMAYTSQKLSRWLGFLMGGMLMMVVGLLFMLKAWDVRNQHECVVPKDSHTITATVHIGEISDGVYHQAMGMHYRQKAVLSDLRLVDNVHKYADNAKTTANPFGGDDVAQNISLPKTMTVLLTAFASNKKEFGVLSGAKPNTKITMTLLISPVHHSVGDGFDGYRWLRTRHIHANAKILAIDGEFVPDDAQKGIVPMLENWRWRLREHFYQDWQNLSPQDRQNKAITLSLLTGDRSLIDKETKELYQFGGISHLLAISGTHVVFLAMILANMMVWLTDKYSFLYTKISRTSIRLFVMIVVGVLYALFTGFDVPAVRTVYMLMAVALVRYLALPISNVSALSWVALVMIWLDPYVVWQAGFWLSFVAVWLLMQYGVDETSADGLKPQMTKLIKLQGWLFIAMLPVSLWLFGKVSLWGLVINLFAVGLFGMVIVPINLLAGVLFVITPWLSDVLWAVSAGILGLLHGLLGWIDDVAGSSWVYQSMGKVGLVLMGLSLLPFVAPMLHKKYAAIPMLALAFVLMGKPTNQHLSILPVLDDSNISGLLIRQSGADMGSVNHQANWLVLGDFGGRLSPQQAQTMTNTLIDVLKKHRVHHLTGVVVQTPSNALNDVVQGLSKDIVIYRYWQASKSFSQIPAQSCTAGELWQGNGLSVRALTGWHQIADETVWGCTLEFDSTQAISLPSVQHEAPTRLIINGATHKRAWELYAMLCHAPNIAPKPTHLWLSHPKSAMSDDVLRQFSPQHIITDPKQLR